MQILQFCRLDRALQGLVAHNADLQRQWARVSRSPRERLFQRLLSGALHLGTLRGQKSFVVHLCVDEAKAKAAETIDGNPTIRVWDRWRLAALVSDAIPVIAAKLTAFKIQQTQRRCHDGCAYFSVTQLTFDSE